MQVTRMLSADKSLLQVAMRYPHCSYATCIKNFGARLKLLLMTDADLQPPRRAAALFFPSTKRGRFFNHTFIAPEVSGLQFQQSW